MSMTFYYKPMSSATRVHWALEEVGAAYEKVKLNLDGDQRKPEFLALNPNGKVPLLVVDGKPVFESLAQLLYIGETYGVDKGLFPKPGLDRAEAFKWLAWGSVSIHEVIARILKNGDRAPEDERSEKARASAQKEAAELFGILDAHLATREYILGADFSICDCALAAYVPFVARLGVDFAACKNVQAWSARCMARPALQRVMQG
jgi:glutathione S-transferase